MEGVGLPPEASMAVSRCPFPSRTVPAEPSQEHVLLVSCWVLFVNSEIQMKLFFLNHFARCSLGLDGCSIY